MRKGFIFLMAAALAVTLSGCGFLHRSYSSVSPHSATYYESEDRSVLRAESYQDLVNDLLLLVGGHGESGTILYYPNGGLTGSEAAERACAEVQHETPLGAYAVDYMTYTVDEDKGAFSQVAVEIAYRRTAEQVAAMVHATSVSALEDLLTATAENGGDTLVLQLGYFRDQSRDVLDTVARVQESLGVAPETWQVHFYPNAEHAGIIEILLTAEEPTETGETAETPEAAIAPEGTAPEVLP
ncbi:MAG: hypothetical protein II904_01575 [Oscillospiraceae bacterium]|nr:hypothetical protein [Oscillospiraceae bacterium]